MVLSELAPTAVTSVLSDLSTPTEVNGSSVCVMQWTGVIRDGTLI